MSFIKLKHYSLFKVEELDPLEIFNQIFSFNKIGKMRQLYSYFKFRNSYIDLVKQFQATKWEEERRTSSGRFKIPEDIDLMSLGARQEIDILIPELETNYSEVAAKLIMLTCYEEIYKESYTKGLRSSILLSEIMNLDLVHVIGLVNEIIARLNQSNSLWSIRFSEIEVSDPDYLLAGGSILGKFTPLAMLEFACERFNLNDEEAWRKSFSLIQTAIWKKQSEDHIREKMTKIKEARFKSQQRN